MSEEYGNDFITLTDEDGNEIELEHLDTVEYNGQTLYCVSSYLMAAQAQ